MPNAVRRLIVFVTSSVLVAALQVAFANPAVSVPNPPLWSPSHYVDLSTHSDYYDLGYTFGRNVFLGNRPQNSVVILDWGGQDQNASGTWGAISPNHLTYRTNAVIEDRSEAFGVGFYVGTGTNTTAHLTLLVGTNNSLKDGGTAGQKWANAVDVVADYFSSQVYGQQVSAAGANDLEFLFGTGAHAHDWATAYSNNTARAYYDFGGCAGCIQENPTPWTMEQVYYVAWGAPGAFPFPEDYNQSGVKARQWQQLGIYTHREHGLNMLFQATLTQNKACDQTGNCDPSTTATPDVGWTEMWECLNTQCSYDGNNAPNYLNQGIKWSSDIKYTPWP